MKQTQEKFAQYHRQLAIQYPNDSRSEMFLVVNAFIMVIGDLNARVHALEEKMEGKKEDEQQQST